MECPELACRRRIGRLRQDCMSDGYVNHYPEGNVLYLVRR